MAVTPKSILVSEIKLFDTDSSGAVYLIVDAGAPDGGADPQNSASKGSLYFRTDATDDTPCLYCKIDEDGATEDWVAVCVDNDGATKTMNAAWTFGTNTPIKFRDTGQAIYSPAANVGALALASGDVWRLGSIANSDYVQVDYAGEVTLVGDAMLNSRYRFEIFDDFLYRVVSETNTPWILNSGSDGSAVDPAIGVQEEGVVVVTTGAGDGTTAVDGSQIICHIPVQADSAGLVFEARLHINTAITNVSVFFGLTDVTTLEEAFTNAADVITSNASDAVGFLYDTSATTDTWWGCAVDGDTDDAGNATTGTAPTAATYQVLRGIVDATGATCAFYIDDMDTAVLTLSGDAGVSPDVNLYLTVIACGDGTLSKTVDVDYMYVGHVR